MKGWWRRLKHAARHVNSTSHISNRFKPRLAIAFLFSPANAPFHFYLPTVWHVQHMFVYDVA